MKDKDMRPVLIEWLKVRHETIRIYEEKSIGSSICDVMAVTDTLSGFEIKSDVDDLRRLGTQAHQYERMFLYCWLVVGDKHLVHAKEIIGDNWGILCVCEDGVTVVREAKRLDKEANVPLRLLWKPELKNLLIKNGLPLYAQKNKEYIRDRLCESVDREVLLSQIADELRMRDSDEFGVVDYDEYERGGFPASEVVDALSENDLSTFTLDKWIALYRQAKQVQEEKETAFETRTVERTPHAIPYTDIEVRPGVPWIDKAIIWDFVLHLLGKPYSACGNCVEYETVTGAWHIKNKSWLLSGCRANRREKFGIPRYDVLHILEATLNLREIKLFDDGTTYNERDTIAALEKQKLMLEEFQTWVRQDLGVVFEDLEITTLFLDEAHNYKNMPIKTALKNLTGINTKGSEKCLDMLHKVRYVQQSGRGAVFATGTPLCNSIADAYVMQMYVTRLRQMERKAAQ